VILVKHVRRSSFNLRINYLAPQPLGFDGFATSSFFFVASVKLFKLISPTLEESWTFIGTHQSPFTVSFYSLHEKIRYPESIEKVTRSVFFGSIIFTKLKKLNYICMPRLQVDCE